MTGSDWDADQLSGQRRRIKTDRSLIGQWRLLDRPRTGSLEAERTDRSLIGRWRRIDRPLADWPVETVIDRPLV